MHAGVRLSGLEGASKSPSKKRSSSSTVSLDKFFSPEEKESNTMASKRIKMSEEAEENVEDILETSSNEMKVRVTVFIKHLFNDIFIKDVFTMPCVQ